MIFKKLKFLKNVKKPLPIFILCLDFLTGELPISGHIIKYRDQSNDSYSNLGSSIGADHFGLQWMTNSLNQDM